MYMYMVRSVEVLKFEDILCAGGEERLLSTPADTQGHSSSHVGVPMEVDSESENSHAETTGRHTGIYYC